MRIFKCNRCGQEVEQNDNERLVVHICGSGDVVRICPVCKTDFAFTEQERCLHCRATDLAAKVVAGELGLIDAIKEM